jgi:hypothetical protein
MMKFLRASWRNFFGIFQSSPKSSPWKEVGLADWPVHSGENLARYIFSRNHFTVFPPRVKFNAFLPPADLELSVFRITGLTEDQIWTIGTTRVATTRGKTPKARGDVKAASVKNGLSVQRDPLVERHAIVIGWPSEPSARQLLAKELAAAATLLLPPQPL